MLPVTFCPLVVVLDEVDSSAPLHFTGDEAAEDPDVSTEGLDGPSVFEASVLHKDEDTTPENCLICRTANAGPPVRLALGAGWGGTR